MKFSDADHSVPNLGGCSFFFFLILLLENANILKGEINMITSPRKKPFERKRST